MKNFHTFFYFENKYLLDDIKYPYILLVVIYINHYYNDYLSYPIKY